MFTSLELTNGSYHTLNSKYDPESDIHKSTVRSHLIVNTFTFNDITLGSTGVGVSHNILPGDSSLYNSLGPSGKKIWDTPTPVLPSVILLKLKVLTNK